VAEIRVVGTRRDDQEIVSEALLANQDGAARGIDSGHRFHENGRIMLRAKDRANWGGNGVGRQRRGGHLVKQRLEQVVVVPVDQGNVDRNPRKGACR
jgi:hypothetical protein